MRLAHGLYSNARVNTEAKRKAALAALDNHARRYNVTIPERLREFYAGDFERYHMSYVTAGVLSWGEDTFQLALTPPSWLGKDDDAVNGPGGDWHGAKHHLPVFVSDQQLYVVVDLQSPECPTRWYHEEECICKGPEQGASSLDAFLAAAMKTTDKKAVEPADPEQAHLWAEDFADDGPRAFDLSDQD